MNVYDHACQCKCPHTGSLKELVTARWLVDLVRGFADKAGSGCEGCFSHGAGRRSR